MAEVSNRMTADYDVDNIRITCGLIEFIHDAKAGLINLGIEELIGLSRSFSRLDCVL